MQTFIAKTTSTTDAPRTTLTLPWEQRVKSRLRVQLDNGEEAGIILPRGTVLHGNDFLQAEDGTIIQILAAPEQVSVVTCSSPLLFARICYHLGNRHVPLQIVDQEARFLHDHVLEEMALGLGASIASATLPFEPEHGAYASHSSHSHSH